MNLQQFNALSHNVSEKINILEHSSYLMRQLPGRIARILACQIRHIMNSALPYLEYSFLERDDEPLEFRPVFIIGPPRVGSSLIYQAMLNYFDFGYLSNLHCKFYGAPSLLERLVHPSRRRKPLDYRSDFGRTKGLFSPSECGEFWYRFFRKNPSYVLPQDANPAKMRKLRSVIRAFGKASKKPTLFKNLYCSVRLLPLSKALPEALFLVIRRDELQTGHSLLESRMNLYGDYDRWFSLRPPESDKLEKLPAHEQVIEQVRRIHSLINEHRQMIGPDRFFDVEYESFCQDTLSALKRINKFFTGHNLILNRGFDIPSSFSLRSEIRIDSDIYEKMVAYAQK